jgi:hypothetical protein
VSQGFIMLQKPFDLAALEKSLREARRWKVDPTPRAAPALHPDGPARHPANPITAPP